MNYKLSFTAIDFETAHADFPCEIGICCVEEGMITETRSYLIKPACFPYMNPWNERVHGISSADVATAPFFEDVWTEIKPFFEDNYLVAHNAAFDMKVLRSVLQYYDLAVPYSEYFCSVNLSRKAWKNMKSHSLGNLCDYHGISFTHHRAGEDARACAIITLKAFEELGVDDLSGIAGVGVKLQSLRK
jgi:DNA polymerase III subunit epsilon